MHCSARTPQSFVLQETETTKKTEATPKHPLKLHIWGAISSQGAASVVMFGDKMDAVHYADILDATLVPIIADRFSDGSGHRFQMDNDTKHRSNHIENYLEKHGINWWPTPLESPDLNPILNLCGSLKQYFHTTHKPRNLEQLKEGYFELLANTDPSCV